MAGQPGGVVRSASQQDACMLRAMGLNQGFGQQDHGMQLHAVAHGDHHVPPLVVQHRRRSRVMRRSLAGIVGILGRLSGAGQHDSGNGEAEHSTTAKAHRQGHGDPFKNRQKLPCLCIATDRRTQNCNSSHTSRFPQGPFAVLSIERAIEITGHRKTQRNRT